jgi:hypothetical protein
MSAVEQNGHCLTHQHVARVLQHSMDVQMRLLAIAGVTCFPKPPADRDRIPDADAHTSFPEVPQQHPHVAAFEKDMVASHVLTVDLWRRKVLEAVDRGWRVALLACFAVTCAHIVLAWFCGGKLRHFFWPLLAVPSLVLWALRALISTQVLNPIGGPIRRSFSQRFLADLNRLGRKGRITVDERRRDMDNAASNSCDVPRRQHVGSLSWRHSAPPRALRINLSWTIT